MMKLRDFLRLGYGVRKVRIETEGEPLFEGDPRKIRERAVLESTVTLFGTDRGILEIEIEGYVSRETLERSEKE